MKFAFISRHKPTKEQYSLTEKENIELIHIGDFDAFTLSPSILYNEGAFEGAIVVHPSAALNLAQNFIIGVFENEMRAKEGEKPTFKAKALHLYDLRD